MADVWDQFKDAAPTTGTPADPWASFRDAPSQVQQPAASPAASAQPAGPDRSGFWSGMDAFGRGAADMATFGLADEISAGLGAATGIGGTFGDYSGNLARQRGIDKADEQQQEVPRLAGQVAGAVALPAKAAAQGAGLGARMLLGAGTGAAQGAAYGFGSGEGGLEPRLEGAGWGGLFGAGFGAAAPAVVAGAQAAVGAGRKALSPVLGFLNPEQEAASRVGRALQRDAQIGADRLSPDEFSVARATGEPVAVVDMGGEKTRSLARSAANTSPEAREALQRTTSQRFEGQADRVADEVTNLSPLGANATGTLDRLKEAAAAANRPAYARAYAAGESGVWNNELAALTRAPDVADAIRGATRTGANRAVIDGWKPIKNPFVEDGGNVVLPTRPDGSQAVPTLAFWDAVKRNLDSTIGKAQRTGDNEGVAVATQLKNQLVAKLDEAVPAYAQARRGAAAAFGAEDALEAGQKFVSARGQNAEYAKAIGQFSDPERKLFREGFASSMAAQIREASDRRNVINQIYQSPAARQRILMALGSDGAAKLEARVRLENIMDRARTAVSGNSTTARQLAEMGLAGGAGLYFGGDIQSAGAGTMLAWALRKGGAKIDERVAQKVGEWLSSSDPKLIERAMTLVSKPAYLEAIRQAEGSIARTGGAIGSLLAQ